MRRISMGNRFNTAAGIACQFNVEQVMDLSWHTRCLKKRNRIKIALRSDQASHQQKESKG